MNYSVTLQTLRKAGACYSGYNKVVRVLQGKEFAEEDKVRESYLRFNHREEIPLTFILKNNGFEDTLWALRCFKGIKEAERDTRLFAVWCARQVQHLMKDKRSFKALEVAERFADGEASRGELEVASAAASDAASAAAFDSASAHAAARAAVYASDAASAAYAAAARAAARAAVYASDAASAARAACDAASAAAAYASDATGHTAKKAQKEMLLLTLENKAPWQIC